MFKIIVTVFLSAMSLHSFAQDNIDKFIYKITVTRNAETRILTLIQTGFQSNTKKGIITSLHGVIGAVTINARNKFNKRYTELKIVEVDFENDIALLSNENLASETADGLPSSSATPGTNAEVIVKGHPKDIDLKTYIAVKIGSPAIVSIQENIPLNERDAMARRRSPNLSQSVINIQYGLEFGFSGSPILNSNRDVIGVVCGGLIGSPISFGIIFSRINFSSASLNRQKMETLSRFDVNNKLFSYQIDAEEVLTTPFKTLSDNIYEWYYGTIKLYQAFLKNKRATVNALDYFNPQTLNVRIKGILETTPKFIATWGCAYYANAVTAKLGHPERFDIVNVTNEDGGIQKLEINVVYQWFFKESGYSFDCEIPGQAHQFNRFVRVPEREADERVNFIWIIKIDSQGRLYQTNDSELVTPDHPHFRYSTTGYWLRN